MGPKSFHLVAHQSRSQKTGPRPCASSPCCVPPEHPLPGTEPPGIPPECGDRILDPRSSGIRVRANANLLYIIKLCTSYHLYHVLCPKLKESIPVLQETNSPGKFKSPTGQQGLGPELHRTPGLSDFRPVETE